MKVSLRKDDKTTGLFKKTTEFELFVKVELSSEERDAIKKAGIDDYILVEYAYKGTELNYQVKSVVHSSDKGSERRFVASDAIERDRIEQKLKEQLAALKSQIEGQLTRGKGTETFEL